MFWIRHLKNLRINGSPLQERAPRTIFSLGRKDPHKPISDTHHTHLLKNWCKAAGVTAETKATHSIRKTKATIIYRETQNVEAVRKLLGHRSIAATSAYLGVEDSEALALALKTRI